MAVTVGILGLQGCCEPHEQAFASLDVDTIRVREIEELEGIDALVMPGGESTTMLKTARPGFWDAVKTFSQEKPVWGICAGSILMAKTVTHPEQSSLGLIDFEIARNAWGAQNESFNAPLSIGLSIENFPGIFIRAPRITKVGDGVEVVARFEQEPVMVRAGKRIACTFHPELADDTSLHQAFLALI